ncbi:DUF1284 domain-containing protein [Oricola cellulosilytica]|uniref:DUF1284 domain-containing protein n=1 Tax=Oricola cellulosilytica TaxID=1429082 RepID=A0A4R0PDL0_9HYPH|nr:DUF1284 domain-containing protein [Oricola cellulosilytica]TCD13326.1 DUF1284 domain-containing protein [Oricola cellulosilytica]
MTVRLRPHHLLCVLTYVGEGYGASFTANYDVIAERIADGEDILLVDGADDICAPLLAEDDPHCHRQSVIERDAKATEALTAPLAGSVRTGERVVLCKKTLERLRDAFARGAIRSACVGCSWESLCNAIAEDGYAQARVRSSAAATLSS